MLIGGQRDIRYMPIICYSRLIGYDLKFNFQPDILSVRSGGRAEFSPSTCVPDIAGQMAPVYHRRLPLHMGRHVP